MSPKKHKRKWIFPFLCLVPLLTGCWDSREIEKRATILAIGIDRAEREVAEEEDEISHMKGKIEIPEERMIKLTVQIAIPGRIPLGPQIGGGEKSPVLVVQAVGHTLEDALLNIQQEVADELFLGHLRLIVVNEDVAREGLGRFNDYLRRNPQIRRTASLVVSQERASEYMKLKPELERVPSLYLAEMVESLIQLGRFPQSFLGLFWSTQSSMGQEAYLPYFQIKGKANIQMNGLAYFQGDKMVGKTKPRQIGIFMAGIGDKKGGYGAFIKIPEMEQVVLVHAVERKTKVKPNFINGEPHVVLKIRYECEVDEVESTNSTNLRGEHIESLEREFSNEITKELEKLVAETQEVGSDIFGFGEYFRARQPDYWKKNIKTKEAWRNIYANLTYDVEIRTHIRRTGMKAK